MAGKRILMLVGDFAEDYEVMVPFQARERAPEYIRLNSDVIKAVQHFANWNKPIAAIHHGAQLLAAADVLQGKRCSAYPACGPNVTRAGGLYADIPVHEAVVDGNFVSCILTSGQSQWMKADE